jgi:hypothetical protein
MAINTRRKPKKTVVTQPTVEETPKAQDRALGGLRVRMCCKDETHEWNFRAKSPFDAIIRGQKICKENGFRFPQDVIIWDW